MGDLGWQGLDLISFTLLSALQREQANHISLGSGLAFRFSGFAVTSRLQYAGPVKLINYVLCGLSYFSGPDVFAAQLFFCILLLRHVFHVFADNFFVTIQIGFEAYMFFFGAMFIQKNMFFPVIMSCFLVCRVCAAHHFFCSVPGLCCMTCFPVQWVLRFRVEYCAFC